MYVDIDISMVMLLEVRNGNVCIVGLWIGFWFVDCDLGYLVVLLMCGGFVCV